MRIRYASTKRGTMECEDIKSVYILDASELLVDGDGLL
jgi:hypothetical protein